MRDVGTKRQRPAFTLGETCTQRACTHAPRRQDRAAYSKKGGQADTSAHTKTGCALGESRRRQPGFRLVSFFIPERQRGKIGHSQGICMKPGVFQHRGSTPQGQAQEGSEAGRAGLEASTTDHSLQLQRIMSFWKWALWGKLQLQL